MASKQDPSMGVFPPALTRGQKAAATRAKNKAAKPVKPSGLPMADLSWIIEGLESATAEINGFGSLISATIEFTFGDDESKAVATYADNEWRLAL